MNMTWMILISQIFYLESDMFDEKYENKIYDARESYLEFKELFPKVKSEHSIIRSIAEDFDISYEDLSKMIKSNA